VGSLLRSCRRSEGGLPGGGSGGASAMVLYVKWIPQDPI